MMLKTSKMGALAVLIFVFLLSSCAYHGKIDSGFYAPPQTGKKIPVSVALDNSGGKILPITNGSKGGSYYVETKDAVLSSAEKVLGQVFDTGNKPPVYTVEPSFHTLVVRNDNWNINQIYESRLCLVFRKCDTGEVYWQSCDTQRVVVSPPAESTALSFLTGASLFILSPITIPAAIQSEGDNGVARATEYLTRSFDRIQDDIVKNKLKFIVSDAMTDPSLSNAPRSDRL